MIVVLPAPFGPDQEPEVGLEDGEVDAVDRLEAVEGDGQAADLEIVGLHQMLAFCSMPAPATGTGCLSVAGGARRRIGWGGRR